MEAVVLTIRIVTDSTCDLPPHIIEAYNIKVVPLFIHFGQESYQDGIDLSREAFYARLARDTTHPTTAAPGITQFQTAYAQLAAEGASAILSIHISSDLSSVVEVARLAATEFDEVPVTVIDSKAMSLAMGFIVQKVAEAIAEGQSIQDLLTLIDHLSARTYVFAVLGTTQYLKRSGRVSGWQNGLGALLQIKPLLKHHHGVSGSELIRTSAKAIERVIQLVEAVGVLERLALVHTDALDKAQALRRQAQHLFPQGEEPLAVNVTPVIGTHIGPGAVGFAVLAAAKSS